MTGDKKVASNVKFSRIIHRDKLEVSYSHNDDIGHYIDLRLHFMVGELYILKKFYIKAS